MDFASEINTVDDLQGPLLGDGDGDKIEADRAAQIVVVAECLAAMRGHPSGDLPGELATKLDGIGYSQMIYQDVRDKVSEVIARSELAELWAEDDPSDWNVAMTDLIERLGKPKRGAGKKPKRSKKKPQPNPSPCMFCDKPMGNGAFHMIHITLQEDDISSLRQGGWVHLKCLNGALHPKHMIQHWTFEDDEIEAAVAKLLGKDN